MLKRYSETDGAFEVVQDLIREITRNGYYSCPITGAVIGKMEKGKVALVSSALDHRHKIGSYCDPSINKRHGNARWVIYGRANTDEGFFYSEARKKFTGDSKEALILRSVYTIRSLLHVYNVDKNVDEITDLVYRHMYGYLKWKKMRSSRHRGRVVSFD